MLVSQGCADGVVFVPRGTGRTVPENLNDVASPPLAGQHAVEKLTGIGNAGEDADKNLAREGGNGRETFGIVNLHVLHVG